MKAPHWFLRALPLLPLYSLMICMALPDVTPGETVPVKLLVALLAFELYFLAWKLADVMVGRRKAA